MSNPETVLQGKIMEALKKRGVWAFRINSGSSHGAGGRMQGAPKGTPDICLPGLRSWIEVKLPGEELNENQLVWHARAQRESVRVAIAESVEDALRFVRHWQRWDETGAR